MEIKQNHIHQVASVGKLVFWLYKEDTNFETAEKDRELKYARAEHRREAKGKKASSKEQRTMLNKQGA